MNQAGVAGVAGAAKAASVLAGGEEEVDFGIMTRTPLARGQQPTE
jgi:hypothetical protein